MFPCLGNVPKVECWNQLILPVIPQLIQLILHRFLLLGFLVRVLLATLRGLWTKRAGNMI